MGTAIQFYGKKQVMDEAESRECAAWAIFIGKILYKKTKYDDFDQSMEYLEETIDQLEASGSEAGYTLKFFEGNEKIDEKTRCTAGSFNFKMIEPEIRESRTIGYLQKVQNTEYEKKIKELEKEKMELLAEQEENSQSIGGIFTELIKNPEQLGILANVVRSLFGKPIQQYGMINGMQRAGADAETGEETKEQNPIIQMAQHIEELEKHDSKLVEHLGMVARLAKEDPQQYAAMITMLEMKYKK